MSLVNRHLALHLACRIEHALFRQIEDDLDRLEHLAYLANQVLEGHHPSGIALLEILGVAADVSEQPFHSDRAATATDTPRTTDSHDDALEEPPLSVLIDTGDLLRLIAAVVWCAPRAAIAAHALSALESSMGRVVELEAHALQWMQSFNGAPPRQGVPLALPPSAPRPPLPIGHPWENGLPWSSPSNWPWQWDCVGKIIKAIARLHITAPRYGITELVPAACCSGDLLTLKGTGFGSWSSECAVVFQGPAGTHAATVPHSWTDTMIQVHVPHWARPGVLTLRSYAGHATVCFEDVRPFRLGTSTPLFLGGTPDVLWARAEPGFVEPGGLAKLTWEASPGPYVEIMWIATDEALPVADGDHTGGGTHSVFMAAPQVKTPRRLRFQVAAQSRLCQTGAPPPHHAYAYTWVTTTPTVSIRAIEVTQGVQQGIDDAGPIKTPYCELIEGRATVVRVWLQATRPGGLPLGSAVVLAAIVSLSLGGAIAPLKADPIKDNLTDEQPIIVKESFVVDFRLGAAISEGNKTFKAIIRVQPSSTTVNGLETPNDGFEPYEIEQTFSAQWNSKKKLQVRCLANQCSYHKAQVRGGKSVQVAWVRELARQAAAYLPFAVEIGDAWSTQTAYGKPAPESAADVIDITDDLNDLKEEAWFDDLRFWEDPKDDGAVWLGGIEVSPASPVSGNAKVGGWVCISTAGADSAAHELAHTCGCQHVDIPSAPAPEPHDTLQTVQHTRPVINAATGTVVDKPYELMSYANASRWLTFSNWSRLAGTTK